MYKKSENWKSAEKKLKFSIMSNNVAEFSFYAHFLFFICHNFLHQNDVASKSIGLPL